jgi:DNA gyrase subunit B
VKTPQMLAGLVQAGAQSKRGATAPAIRSGKDGLDWLLGEAKGGMSIQRYKGLGEMNPDQLWETTMDPQKRILLKVQVEDAIGADEIFSTLMGDDVEPRRQFIENNALGVSNLDV